MNFSGNDGKKFTVCVDTMVLPPVPDFKIQMQVKVAKCNFLVVSSDL